jgi:hypothetical protein
MRCANDAPCKCFTGTDLDHCLLLVGLQDLRQVIHALLVDWEEPLHISMVNLKLAVVAKPLANQASMIRQSTSQGSANKARA